MTAPAETIGKQERKYPNYKGLAGYIDSQARPTLLRWRKTETPILKGEAEVLLESFNIYITPAKTAALTAFLDVYGNSKESFIFNPETPVRNSGLGIALKRRVSGLSEPHQQANRILKTWLTFSGEEFTKIELQKLIRFTKNNGVFFDLPSIIRMVLEWDNNKDFQIQTISQEYYSNNKGENQ